MIVIIGVVIGFGCVMVWWFVKDGDIVVLLGCILGKVQVLVDELGVFVLVVECDVVFVDLVCQVFVEIVVKYLKIDVLINNVGIYEFFFVEKVIDEQISGIIVINMVGLMFCVCVVILMMEWGGLIINISSDLVGNDLLMMLVYQVSKVGFECFIYLLIKELCLVGIWVMIVCVGLMYEEGKVLVWDFEVVIQFYQVCFVLGINFQIQGVLYVDLVVLFFWVFVDLLVDVYIIQSYIEGCVF